jgi:hypothetical protein
MRRAAEEIRQHQRDELRRADRLADRSFRIAAAAAAATIASALAGFSAGGRRTSSAAGIISTAATPAIISIAPRQSWMVTSHAASGAIVIGAMTHAGGDERHRKAALRIEPAGDAGHHRREDRGGRRADQKAEQELKRDQRLRIWLASARPAARTIDPVSTTGRGPKRSERLPQTMLAPPPWRESRSSSPWKCR